MHVRLWPILASCAALAVTVSSGGSALASSGPALSRPAARSDSSAWSTVHSPNPNSYRDLLTSVSCASATACAAVGWSGKRSEATLAEWWNGTTWSVVTNPEVGTLNGVSCVSAADCTAVGSAGSTLVESWNGTAWSVVPSPNGSSAANNLAAVSCASATYCTAVGASGNAILAESWNGTAWSVVPSPSPGPGQSRLSAVSCVSASACTAVGYRTTSEFGDRTLAESWDGSKWSVVRTPNKASGYQGNYLTGVSCVPAGSCTAAGYYTTLPDGYDGAKTLVETNSAKP
jgi:hypothetical protein